VVEVILGALACALVIGGCAGFGLWWDREGKKFFWSLLIVFVCAMALVIGIAALTTSKL
jgi:ABC-type spermidine/putrescine transport system permease subunit II